jgi:FkbM family methyltransferase
MEKIMKLLAQIAYIFGYKYFRYGGFYRKYYKQHEEQLQSFFDSLADERSKGVLKGLVNYKKTCWRKHLNNNIVDKKTKIYNKDGVSFTYRYDEYFPNILPLQENEVFLDCGAYIGDTLISLLEHLGDKRLGKYIAFEPETENLEKLKKTIISTGISDMQFEIHNVGLSNKKDNVYFQKQDSSSRIVVSPYSRNEKRYSKIDTCRLDDYLPEEERSKITFIKMDIEGAERYALEGMRETITKYKPKLAICIYHLPDDYFVIPKTLKDMNMEYRFYVRQHENDSYYHEPFETVLYAIP